jgi:hypothetical protein
MEKPSYLNFDKGDYPWRPEINYRMEPQRYKVGKGEQGVLICEPYKTEIGQFWRFREPDIAEESSATIYGMFIDYLAANDFVGADMARKYLQMGFTRARRYANYKGGKKFDKEKGYAPLERGTGEQIKAESAAIFFSAWKLAESNEKYARLKREWKANFG